MSRPLLALAIAAFAAGTAELSVMGLLPELAVGMDIGIPAAGLLVAVYGIGIGIGGPILSMVSSRMPYKLALCLLLSVFVLASAGSVLAPDYDWLVLARLVMALAHGALMGVAANSALSMVPPERRSKAYLAILSGLTFAYVAGVPLVTALGEVAGWRTAFAATGLAGLVALVAVMRSLPRRLPRTGVIRFKELRVLKERMVLLSLMISGIASISLFTVLTYIVPLLMGVSGLSIGGIIVSLFVYGIGLSSGSWVGRRMCNGRVVASALKIMLALVVVLLVLALVLPHRWVTLALLFVWGLLSFALVPLMHVQVNDQAEEAPNLASILNQSAFSLGGAMGALVGGALLHGGLPFYALPLAGAAIMLCNAGLARRVSRLLWRRMELEMMGPIDQPL